MVRPLACVALAASMCCILTIIKASEETEYQQQLLSRLFTDGPWMKEFLQHHWKPSIPPAQPNYEDLDDNDSEHADKRSAVANALRSNRRPRRQPTPALGKAVTPYAGVGVLNDVGSFFNSLRDNLETLASLTPQQQASLLARPPTVVHAPSTYGNGGGNGGTMRRLHALRPLRPSGNIRSYNRRSLIDMESYPGANRHDPEYLWTGLGR